MSDDVPLGLILGLLLVLLVLSAFFSGTETALMRLNRYRLRHRARSGHRGAILAERLLARPDRLIGLILLGNNLVNLSAASLVALVSLRLGGKPAVAAGAFLFTVVVLIFAEVAPKTYAAQHPERVALPASYLYYPLVKAFYPLVWLINLFAGAVLFVVGARIDKSRSQTLTDEELRVVLSEGAKHLPGKRREMMMSILDLGNMTVDDIMVPHNEIVGIDLNDEWDVIVRQIQISQHTRLPVYRDTMDHVLGFLHLRHLRNVVNALSRHRLSKQSLQAAMGEAYFIPEDTALNTQLVNFQQNKQRIALVVDEYGDIQGLVTLEDLLEEIVGEFTSDPAPTHEDVQQESDDSFVVNASANVRALNRMMNWHLPTDGPKTLNGLIVEQLETIPEQGTGLTLDGYPIEILQTSENAVKTVRIHPPAAAEVPSDMVGL